MHSGRLYLVVGLLLTLIVTGIPVAGAQQSPTPTPIVVPDRDDLEEVTVLNVVDGDTIKVLGEGGTRRTVRLIGVDTPETLHPSQPVGCFGPEASDFTKQILRAETTVWLERDVSHVDRYERLLRYVWVEPDAENDVWAALVDGNIVDAEVFEDTELVLLNELLVSAGYAVSSTYAPDVKYQEHFLQAERIARENVHGLWGECDGVEGESQRTSRSSRSSTAAPTATTEMIVADCSPFATFDEAQAYYANHPEAQPIIDPNFDGRACEVYFGVDAGGGGGGGQVPVDPAPAQPDAGAGCDPSYPTVCIPPFPPDLNCGDIPYRRFTVLQPDPHGFDRDKDGVGCESG